MPRLFSGIEIPASVARRLTLVRAGLNGARWIDPENYHVTLRFLGDVDGITYAAFVAPALMATSAMNGALYDSTLNLFYKLRYARTYDAMLATPMDVPDVAVGEVSYLGGTCIGKVIRVG